MSWGWAERSRALTLPLPFRSSPGTQPLPLTLPFQSHSSLLRSRVCGPRRAAAQGQALTVAQMWPGHGANHRPAREGHTDWLCSQGHMFRHQCRCTDQMDHIFCSDFSYPCSRDRPRPPRQNIPNLDNGTQVFSHVYPTSPLSASSCLLALYPGLLLALRACCLPQDACAGVGT